MGVAVGGGRWRAEEEGEAAGSFEKVPPEDLHRGGRSCGGGGSPFAPGRRGEVGLDRCTGASVARGALDMGRASGLG
jgi:hypothetical protein